MYNVVQNFHVSINYTSNRCPLQFWHFGAFAHIPSALPRLVQKAAPTEDVQDCPCPDFPAKRTSYNKFFPIPPSFVVIPTMIAMVTIPFIRT